MRLTTKDSRPKQYFEAFDGLRAYACLMVLANHGWKEFGTKYLSTIPLNLLTMPRFSNPLFFVLSGRVICLSILKNKDDTKINELLLITIIRRIFRLVVPVFFTLFLFYLFQSNAFWYPVSWPKLNLYDVFTLTGNLYTRNQMVGPIFHLWTLFYEMHLSFLVYIIASLTNTFHSKRYIILITCLFLTVWLNSFALHFMFGVLIAQLSIDGVLKKCFSGKPGMVLQVLLFVYFCFIQVFKRYPGVSYIDEWYRKWMVSRLDKPALTLNWSHSCQYCPSLEKAITASILIVLVETNSILGFVFGNPIMRIFGKASFGFYLMHLLMLNNRFIESVFAFIKDWNTGCDHAIVFLSVVFVLVVIGYLFYLTIDKASMKLGHLFVGYLKEGKSGIVHSACVFLLVVGTALYDRVKKAFNGVDRKDDPLIDETVELSSMV